jgi:Trk-type K+ transport system membrane component
MCFVLCIVMYYQIKHQQNAHVLSISFNGPSCFGSTGPSSGCLLLQNVCHNVHVQYTGIYNSMD